MSEKRYLDLEGLTSYDELIKNHINNVTSDIVTKLEDGTTTITNAEHSATSDSATVAESATMALRLGSVSVGDTSKPIYLNNGVATEVDSIGIEYGGTGSATIDGARENLDVYSKSEVDSMILGDHSHKVENITDLTVTATELNHMDGVISNVQAQLDSKVDENHTHSWNDLDDKPFYETEPVDTLIVPTLTFNNWYYEDKTNLSPFVVGQKGAVIYDGTTYNNVSCVDDDGVVILGNVDGRFNDYPFSVYITNGYLFIRTPYTDGEVSHTIQVTIGVTEVVGIDEKFLPKFAGEVVTGKTFDGQEDVGGLFAEVFNDYEGNVATGDYAHAEGKQTKALGDNSHSEGAETIASGLNSHVEGEYSEAIGSASHAEGYSCVTEAGYGNHSEGFFTTSKGTASHSEGYYTIAGSDCQHVQGQYNIEDASGEYAHIVGNGEHNARSNAHTLDWNGNAWFAGDVTATDDNGNTVSLAELSNVDNTSDVDKPVSTAQQLAIDTTLATAKSYTDTKVADLVGTAPETLNTLEEVAQAIEENEGVVEALNSAIGNKANQNDLEALQDVVDTKIGQDDLTGFMTSENPTGTGSLSMNRKADTTIGNYSVALGIDATASGQSSHAEGYQTTASGQNSHAEGQSTIASGQNSHAEGNSSKAEARYAHAEGDATFATGEASHSEGYNATASGINSHAEGKKTTASKDNAHAEGAYTTASGINSHAEGDTTFATGTNSHAEGNVARANGLNSHAEGYYTTANGENQHVQGKFNAIDNNNTYAHIVGGGTSDAYADRKNIHTLDWDGNADFAGDVTATDSEGNKISLIELANNSDSGDYLTTENPTGTGSFSMNRKADTTIGNYSITLGYNTTASGDYSHAEGQNTEASGTASHSEGWSAKASGQYSHAEGAGAKAVGAFSHAEGEGSEAEGRSSHAEGWQSEAIGDYSHAEGSHTIASGENQHVQGKYNIEDENNTYAHIVGNGNIDENYEITCSNAHTLDWNGNAWFAGDVTATDSEGNSISLVELANSNSGSGDYLAIDNPTGTGSFSINRKADTTVGDYSVAMGYNNEASGYHSVAEGSETVASGSISHSEGLETTASGTYSHAEGCYTTASGAYGTHAEGAYTTASGQHSHAEGLNTIAQGLVQHVQGKYNVADTSDDYAHIVGGGKSDTDRKNIHTLDWYGNASFAGNVTATSSNGTAVRLIGHTHDDRYYTESEIDTKLNAKANSSHGNHVPAKETANNARFLRNDNTWQTITPANIGASVAHSHPYLPTAGGTVTGTLTASGGILISGASKLTNLLNLGDTLAPDKSRYYINGNATGRFNALRYVTTSKLSSARRYKENIEYTDIDYWHDRLMKVKPCTFNFINDEDKKFNVGVIAEDLEEYLPEFVDYNENGECESVYYTEFIIPMLSEIQRLNGIVEELRAEINALKSNVE